MTSKNKESKEMTFEKIYEKQIYNQNMLLKKGAYDGFKSGNVENIPVDDNKLMSYHIQQLVSEIGEVLTSDKRWKNFRNGYYNKDEKIEEIADLLIVTMNIAIFSGFSSEDVVSAVLNKLDEVESRIKEL